MVEALVGALGGARYRHRGYFVNCQVEVAEAPPVMAVSVVEPAVKGRGFVTRHT